MKTMQNPGPKKKKASGKFLRAKIRHSLLTRGADRLLGGRLSSAYREKPVEVRSQPVDLANWPAAWTGLRIAHFSDMHFGDLMTVEKALGVVDLVKQQSPHLVAYTGDMIDLECEGAEPIFEAMAAIDAPLGSWMVMGNHDYLDDGDAVRRMAEDAGVKVLDEDTVTFARGEYDLAGVGDGTEDEFRMAGIDWDRTVKGLAAKVDEVVPSKPHLLLAHNPKAFLRASKAGIPLTLSGHTHGGQVATSKKPGVNLAVAHRLSAGLYERDGCALFVTVGVGAWFPLRVHCPAEVVMVTPSHGRSEG
ncbi:MAG: metallophosphoesterase family protein [Phycisphaerales bacterium]|nr:metallophosphoesterase family protein [Phycisphaerales bacterium]